MNSLIKKTAIVLVCASMAGCSNTEPVTGSEVMGAIAGGVIGGGIGSLIGQGTGQAVAIGVGIVGGALLGGYIAHYMDESDRANMNSAMNNSSYKSTTWTNSSTGNTYMVTPTSGKISYNGYSDCRTYQTKAYINGEKKVVTGTACHMSDGSWRAMN